MLIAGTSEFMLFSLIFMRMSGFVFMNPIFGRRHIPNIVKLGMAVVLTLVTFPIAVAQLPEIGTTLEFGFLLLKEFLVGLLLGMIVQLFLFVVNYAGAIIDFEMALGMASVYDPQTGVQIALTGNIFNIFLLMLFFAVDGHLMMMDILITSADIVPYSQISFSPGASEAVIEVFIDCISMAMKLAFPILGIILLQDTGVGILMKIIPQINVFILNIPLKILVGFSMLMLLSSPIGDYFLNIIDNMLNAMQYAMSKI